MKHFANIFTATCMRLAAMVMAAGAMVSCDGLIYDDEGDCDPYYKVKFVYDMNLKWADAFSNEVNEVTLYVVDEQGKIVWQKHESGAAVKAEGYLMDVDVEPGTYTLIAWCGEGHTTHFSVTDTDRHTDLDCRLQRDYDEAGAAVLKRTEGLKRLYHGKLEAQEFPDKQGVHVYTVNLTKDTNEVHVVLQHLSGEPVDKDQYIFTVTDSNGLMAWDNALKDDERITYHAWATRQGNAEIIYPFPDTEKASRAPSQFSAAVASISVPRLMMEHEKDCLLTVYNKESGEMVFSVPLIQYAKMVKGNYDRPMSDQEYLDRQDEYNMTFFLDRGGRWIDTFLYIESWMVVIQDTGI